MRFKILSLSAFAALLLLVPATALADECCECCAGKACAMTAKHDGDQAAAGVLGTNAAAPVRQTAIVWFMRPVLITDQILQGKYIIEHDTDRMARGLPCTHIYAANNPRVPAVAFHCTHLEKEIADRSTVTVVSTGEPSGLLKLTAFQFAGETAAHGVPSKR